MKPLSKYPEGVQSVGSSTLVPKCSISKNKNWQESRIPWCAGWRAPEAGFLHSWRALSSPEQDFNQSTAFPKVLGAGSVAEGVLSVHLPMSGVCVCLWMSICEWVWTCGCECVHHLCELVCVSVSVNTCASVWASIKILYQGTSLAVQWLRLCASNAGDAGSIPLWGTKVPRASRPKKKKKKYCISQGPSREQIAHANWVIWRELNKETVSKDIGKPQRIAQCLGAVTGRWWLSKCGVGRSMVRGGTQHKSWQLSFVISQPCRNYWRSLSLSCPLVKALIAQEKCTYSYVWAILQATSFL